MRPIKGNVYTVKEIENLTLEDSPFLVFKTKAPIGDSVIEVTIQDSYTDRICQSEIKDCNFKYSFTTSEGCPIFHYVGDITVLLSKLTLECELDPFMEKESVPGWYAYLKGTDSRQYYRLNDSKTAIVIPGHTSYPDEEKTLPWQIKKYLESV